jgi:hypothetical protein
MRAWARSILEIHIRSADRMRLVARLPTKEAGFHIPTPNMRADALNEAQVEHTDKHPVRATANGRSDQPSRVKRPQVGCVDEEDVGGLPARSRWPRWTSTSVSRDEGSDQFVRQYVLAARTMMPGELAELSDKTFD